MSMGGSSGGCLNEGHVFFVPERSGDPCATLFEPETGLILRRVYLVERPWLKGLREQRVLSVKSLFKADN